MLRIKFFKECSSFIIITSFHFINTKDNEKPLIMSFPLSILKESNDCLANFEYKNIKILLVIQLKFLFSVFGDIEVQ